MVRHISTDDGDILVLGHAAAGVIERFIIAVGSSGAGFGKAREISGGCGWIDHGRQCRGVWCDDYVLAEAPFEPQPGHTKAGILVREVEIASVVGRL